MGRKTREANTRCGDSLHMAPATHIWDGGVDCLPLGGRCVSTEPGPSPTSGAAVSTQPAPATPRPPRPPEKRPSEHPLGTAPAEGNLASYRLHATNREHQGVASFHALEHGLHARVDAVDRNDAISDGHIQAGVLDEGIPVESLDIEATTIREMRQSEAQALVKSAPGNDDVEASRLPDEQGEGQLFAHESPDVGGDPFAVDAFDEVGHIEARIASPDGRMVLLDCTLVLDLADEDAGVAHLELQSPLLVDGSSFQVNFESRQLHRRRRFGRCGHGERLRPRPVLLPLKRLGLWHSETCVHGHFEGLRPGRLIVAASKHCEKMRL
mmetsp:Transcript_76862/g.222125  ORF Transcript_76862/g.222125 Transcript_76862/m.222125 type:complete len:325 (-) Transcript_76862:25-999(-)